MENNTMEEVNFNGKENNSKIALLIADVMRGRYGTKNRAELFLRLEEIDESIHLAEQSLVQRIRDEIGELERIESKSVLGYDMSQVERNESYNDALDDMLNLPSLSTTKPKGDK
jgi:hypothetical protein